MNTRSGASSPVFLTTSDTRSGSGFRSFGSPLAFSDLPTTASKWRRSTAIQHDPTPTAWPLPTRQAFPRLSTPTHPKSRACPGPVHPRAYSAPSGCVAHRASTDGSGSRRASHWAGFPFKWARQDGTERPGRRLGTERSTPKPAIPIRARPGSHLDGELGRQLELRPRRALHGSHGVVRGAGPEPGRPPPPPGRHRPPPANRLVSRPQTVHSSMFEGTSNKVSGIQDPGRRAGTGVSAAPCRQVSQVSQVRS
jgi:hypothetical protein